MNAVCYILNQTVDVIIFFIMLKTYTQVLQAITQPVIQDSSDRSKAYTVTQDNNNQV